MNIKISKREKKYFRKALEKRGIPCDFKKISKENYVLESIADESVLKEIIATKNAEIACTEK